MVVSPGSADTFAFLETEDCSKLENSREALNIDKEVFNCMQIW